MRLLFEIDTKDYDRSGVVFVRHSARCIHIKNGLAAMVHSVKYDYYKFPGGGIETGESAEHAMIRETREEAGLVVIPGSVKEYGYVHRIQKSDHDGAECFIQDNYYFLCDVEESVQAQNLDDYEADERFTLEYVEPDKAIFVNRNADHGPADQIMLEREARVLELLKEEGYFRELEAQTVSHTVEILSVGTELLLGNIVNSDARDLSRELSGLGLNVLYHSVVGDNPGRLRDAVALARTRADVIITTGGLGPTCDDLTKQVLAECFGKRLVWHPECAESIRCFFHRMGKEMPENNLQQAYLPEGCTVLDNAWGTAPGCAFEADGVHVVMLPGPPSECLPMFRERAAAYLARLSEGVIRSRTLRVFGMGESEVEARLRDRMNELTNPTLAPYAKEGEVELRITAKAGTAAEADALIAPVEAEVRGILGDFVYGADVSGLEQVVLDGLKARGLTLGTAESCTGGLIAKRLTDLPGASAVFRGGVVSYTNGVKAGVLGVPQALLDEKGAVCAEVAEAMAEGARGALGCDLALSVTGVAGPDSDERGNPVGLVYIALAAPDGCRVKELNLTSLAARRDRTRNLAALHALDMARRYLEGPGTRNKEAKP